MCNLYSITTNQEAISRLFRVINRYVGNLPPMPGVFPDYPAPVVRNTDHGSELVTMRWGMPPPPRTGGPPVTNIRNIRHIVFGRTADYAEGQAGFDHSGRSKPEGYAMRKVLYIFGLLSDADVSWIAKTGIQRRLQDGDVLISEGEQTDSLVFLLDGELVASNRALGPFARMGVGEIVGEVSLVDSAPPSATITASGNGLALFLNKEALMQKLAADNGFGSRFYRALAVFLADRLRDARASSGSRSVGDATIEEDELDVGILDRVSNAGDRFNQMLKTLSGARLSH